MSLLSLEGLVGDVTGSLADDVEIGVGHPDRHLGAAHYGVYSIGRCIFKSL